MEFITHKLPNQTGTYIIAAQVNQENGVNLFFNYIAHYDAESKTWHKYDPFIKDEIGEEIYSHLINAWKETGPVFLK